MTSWQPSHAVGIVDADRDANSSVLSMPGIVTEEEREEREKNLVAWFI